MSSNDHAPIEEATADTAAAAESSKPQRRKRPSSDFRQKELAPDYVPSENDVLCGLGKACKMWKGNVQYRALVDSKIDEYKQARTKVEKGVLINSIVDAVRTASPGGGFVKQDPETKKYYEVGDFLAKEKTSQAFRDSLSEKYSSSNRAKYARRKQMLQTSASPPPAKKPRTTPKKPPTKKSRLQGPAWRRAPKTTQTKRAVPPLPTVDSLKVCGLQPMLRADDESPLEATQRVVNLMTDNTVDLYVLPELCPIGYSEDTFAKYLPKTDENKKLLQDIDKALADHAKTLGSFICYGTIGWDDQEHYFIRQKVVNPEGNVVATYDKMYLADYGDCAETRFFTAGNEPVSFDIQGYRFGLLICADMRYPLLSRSYASDHLVDVLLQPAAFSRDLSFRTWKSFRETRAVENAVYFMGVNYGGGSFGESSLVPPWVDEDHEPLVLTEPVGALLGHIERKMLSEARSDLPFHAEMMKSTSAEV